MKKKINQKGSLLLEILLAVAVGAIIIGAVAELMYVGSKSSQVSGAKSSAISLAEEGLEAVQSIGEADWHNIYLPPDGTGDGNAAKGLENPYYAYKIDNGDGSFSWALGNITDAGNEGNVEIDGIIYTRKIFIDNVDRQKTGDRKICSKKEIIAGDVAGCMEGEYVDDPSTQKIKVTVSKNGSADIVLEEYLTRWKNETSSQSDWSISRPATELDCQNANGAWDTISSQCYAVHPGNKNNWGTYDSNPGEFIDNTSVPGSIKLKTL